MRPLALINAVTGRSLTAEDAAAIGLRVITMERLFNVREGLRRKDDVLPDRLTVDPAPDGPGKGQRVPVDALLDDGYAAMGWDADGVPTAETLARWAWRKWRLKAAGTPVRVVFGGALRLVLGQAEATVAWPAAPCRK